MLEASTTQFAIYPLYYKKEFWIINTAYDLYLRYSSDKLKTIAFIYQQKASFVPFYTIQIIKFLPNDQVLSNKQL